MKSLRFPLFSQSSSSQRQGRGCSRQGSFKLSKNKKATTSSAFAFAVPPVVVQQQTQKRRASATRDVKANATRAAPQQRSPPRPAQLTQQQLVQRQRRRIPPQHPDRRRVVAPPPPMVVPLRPLPLLRGDSDHSADVDAQLAEPPSPKRTTSASSYFFPTDDKSPSSHLEADEPQDRRRSSSGPVDLDEFSEENDARPSFYGLLTSVEDSLKSSPKYGSSGCSKRRLMRKQQSLPSISASSSWNSESDSSESPNLHRCNLSIDTTDTSFFEDINTDIEDNDTIIDIHDLIMDGESETEDDDQSEASAFNYHPFYLNRRTTAEEDEHSEDEDDDSASPIPDESFLRLESYLNSTQPGPMIPMHRSTNLPSQPKDNPEWMMLVCIAAYLLEEMEFSASAASSKRTSETANSTLDSPISRSTSFSSSSEDDDESDEIPQVMLWSLSPVHKQKRHNEPLHPNSRVARYCLLANLEQLLESLDDDVA